MDDLRSKCQIVKYDNLLFYDGRLATNPKFKGFSMNITNRAIVYGHIISLSILIKDLDLDASDIKDIIDNEFSNKVKSDLNTRYTFGLQYIEPMISGKKIIIETRHAISKRVVDDWDLNLGRSDLPKYLRDTLIECMEKYSR